VDLEAPAERKRGKQSVDAALALAQKSTASLGKFDALRHGEKVRKERGKKRQFAQIVGAGGVAAEVQRNMGLLTDILRPKAKAPKKGQREVMDTHDGELPVDFKRKKGRLAAADAGTGPRKKPLRKK